MSDKATYLKTLLLPKSLDIQNKLLCKKSLGRETWKSQLKIFSINFLRPVIYENLRPKKNILSIEKNNGCQSDQWTLKFSELKII